MSAAPSRFHGLRPGTEFGPYTVVRCIGVGGMGSVFEADHRLMRRKVALKVLHASDTPQVNVRERFLREGATLVRLSHPNIVAVYDAGELDGLPYLAMELLEGETLDRLLARDGQLDPARVVRMLAPVADGLELAHGKGIVHRDVKPENLFVTRDERGRELVKLVDFGIAKDLRTSSQHNTIIGTPSYMAPEQLLGAKTIDGRCDQFALAVVAYEALTGRKPYAAESVLELAELLERGEFVPPSARGVMLPPALETALVRALQTKVDARFASAGEFAFALLGSITDRTLPGPARPSSASHPSTSAASTDDAVRTSTVVAPRRPTPTEGRGVRAPSADDPLPAGRTTTLHETLRNGRARSPIAVASVVAVALLAGALALRAYVARTVPEVPSVASGAEAERTAAPIGPEPPAETARATPPAAEPGGGADQPPAASVVTQPAASRTSSPRRAEARSPERRTETSTAAPTLRLER